MIKSNRAGDWDAEFIAAPRLDEEAVEVEREAVEVERERAFETIARLMNRHGIDAGELLDRVAPDYHKEVTRAAHAPSSYDPIFGHR